MRRLPGLKVRGAYLARRRGLIDRQWNRRTEQVVGVVVGLGIHEATGVATMAVRRPVLVHPGQQVRIADVDSEISCDTRIAGAFQDAGIR
jgi:hypothetical protein